MGWSTGETRSKLLNAATAEFSEFGYAGARVDRIAARAKINKERIYQYFGSKNGLYDAVVHSLFGPPHSLVAMEGRGVEAVVAYAGRVYDYLTERPGYARLLLWERLEPHSKNVELWQRDWMNATQKAFRSALPALTRLDALNLVATIIALSSLWHAIEGDSVILREFSHAVDDGGSEQTGHTNPSPNRIRRDAVLSTVRATVAANVTASR